MAAPPTLTDTLRLSDSRRGGHASAAHCVRDGMSHLCFQWRPDPSKKRLRSAVSVPYNTPYSTRSGIGGGAPCFWHGGQGTRGMRNQLGKPHFGLPKRRGTTPQAFTAVRAAGTSGVSPPPGGGSHRDFHLPHANHGMATAAGCWHMLPAPRGAVRFYAAGEFWGG